MRHLNKSYFKIPGGEIQYGHIGKSLTVWFLGKRYRILKGRY